MGHHFKKADSNHSIQDQHLYPRTCVHVPREFTQASGDFPGGAIGKEPACQCRKHKGHKFNP